MGVSYYAVSIVGVKIDFSKLKGDIILVQSCEHPERTGNKFCPICGKKVEVRKEYKEDLADEIEEVLQSYNLPKGYKFHFVDDRIYLLGWGTVHGSYSDDFNFTHPANIPSMDEIKNTLQDIAPAVQAQVNDSPSILDNTNFGLWAGMTAN